MILLQDNCLFKQITCVQAFAACISSSDCILDFVDLSYNMLNKEVRYIYMSVRISTNSSLHLQNASGDLTA
jgi:hypothetical protein